MRSELARLFVRSQIAQWAALLLVSLPLIAVAVSARVPGALMIGPMLAGIVIGSMNATIRMPAKPFIAAQGIVGCMIGRSIPIATLDELVRSWPLFLFGVFGVIATASAIGYGLSRRGVLPGTTAVWGTSPGASTQMIIMSESFGGDMRLVAVMQNLRIVCVVAVAALVARVAGPIAAVTNEPAAANVLAAPFAVGATAAGIGVALGAAYVAALLRIPAGGILLPLAVAMALHGTGTIPLDLPDVVLALAYAAIGWSIGLRFTRPILLHALRVLPEILASVLLLIAVCGLIALLLVVGAGIDPLTAYLATSPGGVDSIAVIAATSQADMRFVMAMQTARLLAALVVSPVLSRWIARRSVDGRAGPGP